MMRRILPILFLLLALAGCGKTTPAATSQTTDVVPTATVQATDVAIATETATPTPAPGLVLIAGADVVPSELQSAVESLAAESGWLVEVRQPIDSATIPPETRVIVWLGDPAEARSLADAAPQARVIAVNAQAGEPSANLSWVVFDPDRQAFLAGYITMLVTTDWRAGGLLPAELPELSEAFLNGGRYLCGRCIPLYAPIVEFPVASSLPSGADGASALAALDALNAKYLLDAVFIHPQVSSEDLLNRLAGQDYVFVGLQTPPEALKSQWAATVLLDLPAALRQAWPQGDTPGAVYPVPLALQDVNPAILTEGRQKLAQQVLQDLQNGLIAPLTVIPGQ